MDSVAAARVCEFFELFLHHSKGEWAGKPFLLEPWQRRLLRTAFGTKRRSDGLRRYRTVFVRIPRKNGKSTLGAGVALYLTTADGEPGAEVYSAANDKEQAGIIFREASRMVKASPELAEMVQVFKWSMIVPETMGSYQAISSDSGTKDGLNPHGVISDEIHELKDRPLWEKLTTAFGARRQPMTWILTTAGVGRHTLYADINQHAEKVAAGEVEDETFLPVLYGAGKDDDWHHERTWKRANPNLGVSVKLEYLREQHRRAVLVPGWENPFRRYHLNTDVEQETRWLRIDAWDACAGAPIDVGALKGEKCFIGLDLSKRTDITASVKVFPAGDTFVVVPHFFVPAEHIAERAKRDDVPYERWVEQGLLTATEGNVIDYAYIEEQVKQDAKDYEVEEVAYDPYGATQLAIRLQEAGVVCVEMQQTMKFMSEPSKALEALVLQRRIRHGGNPVLRWMAGNVATETDANGNIRPSKRKSTARIDGITALVMALGRASLSDDQRSVYEDRGLRVL